MREVFNRLRYVDVVAHAVKAHTQGGVEGAERGNQRGGGSGRMGQGGPGGHGSSHSGGQEEEANGSGWRGWVREREHEDDEEADDERRRSRKTDGDEGVETDWNRTTGEARGEQVVRTRARGLEVAEDDGRGRPGRRRRKRMWRTWDIACDEESE